MKNDPPRKSLEKRPSIVSEPPAQGIRLSSSEEVFAFPLVGSLLVFSFSEPYVCFTNESTIVLLSSLGLNTNQKLKENHAEYLDIKFVKSPKMC